MQEIYLLYKTDQWHNPSSKRLIGSHQYKYKLVNQLLKVDNSLTDSDVKSLETKNQTRDRNANYLIEIMKLNQVNLDN